MSFTFRQFGITDTRCGMKVGTDSVVLGAWTDASRCRRAIDIGAGCGLLSLMLAQRYPQLRVTAVEVDEGAATDCAANIAASPFADRIETICADVFNTPLPQADLIICNPPFFTETLKSPGISRAGARHEGALGVGSLIELAAHSLSPGGSLAFVAPAQRDSEIDLSLTLSRFSAGRILRMRQRPDRPLVRTFRQMWLNPGDVSTHELTVNNPDGSRTDAYTALTRDFYL